MQIAYIGSDSTQQYPAEVVGSKAANVARMAALGLPVPPAFVLPISLCSAVVNGDAAALESVRRGLTDGIKFLEKATRKTFGDRSRPVLVSVRSGAARSMPGMLDTVLDVGCTAAAIRGLVRMTGNPTFAADCRCRFLESYGGTLLAIDRAAFNEKRNALLAAERLTSRRNFDCEALERLARQYEQTSRMKARCWAITRLTNLSQQRTRFTALG